MGYQVWVKTRKNKVTDPSRMWSDKKKLEAVTTYLATGTLAMTSAMTTVPVETLRVWKRSDWWKKYEEELQYEDDIELGTKLTKVMDKALDQVMDRLDNGEFVYDNRTGKVKRVPVSMRDSGKIVNDIIDKKQLIRKRKDRVKAEDQPKQVTADHLVQLAQAFAQFASGKPPEVKPTNVYEGNAQEVFDQLGVETSKEIPRYNSNGLFIPKAKREQMAQEQQPEHIAQEVLNGMQDKGQG